MNSADTLPDIQKNESSLREFQHVFKLSLPFIITMTSQALMQFVDSIMIGHYGKDELAACVPAGLTYFVFATVLIGIASCNNTFVAQCIGRGDTRECGRYTIHTVFLAWIGLLVMMPFVIFAPVVMGFYGHAPEVRHLEVVYFRTIGVRIAASGMIIGLSTFFQGTGKSVIPMYTGIASNILNFIGGYSLIFGKFGMPELGLFGAGIATTCASYFEAFLLLVIYLSGKRHEVYGTRRIFPFEPSRLRQLLRVGIPAGITSGLDLASWSVFMAKIIGRLGTDTLAGNNAAAQIMTLSFMPALGLNIAMTSVVGHHIGMGDINGAKRRAYTGMAVACVYMTIMGALFFLFRKSLIGLFLSADTENIDAVIAAGATSLSFIALFQFADSIGLVAVGALKGAGDTVFPAVAQIIIAWVFFLPVVYFMGAPNHGGLKGAWWSAEVYIWIYDAVIFWRFWSEKWRKIDIFK